LTQQLASEFMWYCMNQKGGETMSLICNGKDMEYAAWVCKLHSAQHIRESRPSCQIIQLRRPLTCWNLEKKGIGSRQVPYHKKNLLWVEH
jgi:hypothetical protein